ncbi:MAG: alginate export family protein, partial [Proteobacteria bacterium]|nr:alginate export family protein [Pseudomonadota bacterium]
IDYLDPAVLGAGERKHVQLLIENELETELFYSFGPALSLFAQLRLKMEWDNFNDQQPEIVTDFFVERGEMWLFSQNVAGSGLNVEIGRLDFEDDRLWWWDEDLDALRISYERDDVEIALSVARELAPSRSDLGSVVPEDNRAFRLIAEASWEFRPNHTLQFFGLASADHSPEETIGEIVRNEDKDDSDADLGWLGVRAMGGWESKSRGVVGYWLDTAIVGGHERLIEFDALSLEPPVVEEPIEEGESSPSATGMSSGASSSSTSVVGDSIERSVHGWALDAGLTWILPVFAEPRITVGYAIGSGDGSPDEGADRSFRQTGLHTNEPGFGGVRRFRQYGLLLDPELSNLSVLTIGVGCSLLQSSSLDLVYHRYRLQEPAASLRSARIDTTLNGRDRDLGQAFDLVLGIEEWERVEVEVAGSVFQAGPAFGVDDHAWVWGGLLTFSVAF